MGFFKKKTDGKEVLHIAVEKIVPNPHQPRTVFKDEGLSALAESIRRYGILQPISLSETQNGYTIIAGERRFRAAKLAGLQEVPCLVYEAEGEKGALLALMENLLREDLNMFETASAMDKLCREHGLTQEQVAQRLSVSQSYVANKLRLLRFDEPMRQKILSAGLTERHARALLRLSPSLWHACADKIIERRLNVEGAERLVTEMLCDTKQEKKRTRVRIRGGMRDLRLFYNSVDRAVEMVKRCGLMVESHKEEGERETRLIICIPKAN